MRKLWTLLTAMIITTNAYAGRHEISRNVAHQIFNERFAQFQREENAREQRRLALEQKEFEEAERKALRLEQEILAEAENTNPGNIKTAEELANELAGLSGNTSGMQDIAYQNENPTDLEQGLEFAGADSGSSDKNADLMNSHELAHEFARLETLNDNEQELRARELLQSLRGLPNSEQLAEELVASLEQVSPKMAAKVRQEQAKQQNTKNLGKNNKDKAKGKMLANKSLAQNKQKTVVGQDNFAVITEYPYEEDKLYRIYAAPNKVTTIMLEPGEKLAREPGCGDNLRWQISSSSLNQGNEPQQIIMAQPTKANINTNLTLFTDRGRTYLLELIGQSNNYMAKVVWNY